VAEQQAEQAKQQGETRSEFVGDHVELVPDGVSQRAFSGDSAEGQDRRDESILNEIGSALVIQKFLHKLFRTVHLVFSWVNRRTACNWGTAASASMNRLCAQEPSATIPFA
jgi:hypothetical protein